MKNKFLYQGFIKFENLISQEDVSDLKVSYDALLSDIKRTAHLRSDLGGQGELGSEKITQLMRPSSVLPELLQSKAYQNASLQAQSLLGRDLVLDFDMLINKMPFTNTPTPWHQDAAYWIDLPDKRAVSCWIALEQAHEKNGCMWFIPKKDDQIRTHHAVVAGGALSCKASIDEAVCIPLQPGDCTFHDGFTLHYSKGNTTAQNRRALILNFRPKDMVALERAQGVDHLGERKVRNKP
jgi:ectoine hydroxylase-related dioxygenase (phytanoyl-CoA dioxygenase family)